MKIFVTGVCGQLGFDVMNELKKRGHEAFGSDIIEKDEKDYIRLDITDKSAVEAVLSETKPDAVDLLVGMTSAASSIGNTA